MTGMAAHKRAKTLTGWRLGLVTASIALVGAGLIIAAAAGSYDNVYHLALAKRVPLPRLTPVELDGGLVGVIAIDIVLTLIGYPVAWLRMIARSFGAGTIVANAAAGWPDPVGVFLRVFAPALIVVITEAVRTVILRHRREQAGEERIPLIRWALAPKATFILWRRMRMWRIRDYGEALEMELARRDAITRLAVRFGPQWESAEDARGVAWLLREGVMMDAALARVAELTAPDPEPPPVVHPLGRRRGSGRKRGRGSPLNKRAASGVTKGGGSAPEPRVPRDVDTQAEALRIVSEEPGISGGELGRRLGKSESYGCRLKRQLAGSVTGPDSAGGASS